MYACYQFLASKCFFYTFIISIIKWDTNQNHVLFSMIKNHEIRHQATSDLDCQLGNCRNVTLIFLRGLCGYVWVKILTLSPKKVRDIEDLEKMCSRMMWPERGNVNLLCLERSQFSCYAEYSFYALASGPHLYSPDHIHTYIAHIMAEYTWQCLCKSVCIHSTSMSQCPHNVKETGSWGELPGVSCNHGIMLLKPLSAKFLKKIT